MSGNRCAYAKCSNSRAKGVKTFGFPRNNAQIWALNSGNPDLIGLSPTSLSKKVLCERHFRQEDILPSGRLSKSALPLPYVRSENEASTSFSPQVQSPSPRVRRSSLSPKRYPGKWSSEKPSPSVSTSSATFTVEKMSPSVSVWIDNASPERPRNIAKRALFLSPTKKKLLSKYKNRSKILASKRAQISNLKRKLFKMKHLKKTALESISFKTKEAAVLFQMQTHKKRQPWTKDEKRLATTLYLRSPSTYKYLCKLMILPADSTVRHWMSTKKCHTTGFNNNLMDQIKSKAESMSTMEKACVVMFDGMAIKKCLEYSQQYDLIEGFEDKGDLGRNNRIAKESTVFMIRGLYYQWKLPIGYFVSEKGLNGKESKTIIKSCVQNLQDAGLTVKAIVCDQSSTNANAYKELGVSIDKPYFLTDNGEKVYAIYDPPHLLKSLRNNLLTHDFNYDEKLVSFSDIRKLFEIEAKSGTTRAAPQLTPAHICPNSFQKMSVSLAAQIFSHTTSAALKTAVSTGQLESSTALNTAGFLSEINSIFDAMNSRTFSSKNPDKCALSKKNPHIIDLFKKALDLFSRLKKVNAKYPRPPCFDGFLLTINAFLGILDDESCQYILTSRLNQDPLENLFASVRQRGGWNRNPTVRVLRATLKILTMQQILEPPKTTSYDPDLDELLEVVHPGLQDEHSSEPREEQDLSDSIPTSSASSEDEEISTVESELCKAVTLEECSQVYFTGYLAHKYNQKFKCNDCFGIMCDTSSSLTSHKELLILNRSFTNIKVDPSSGLISPSEGLLYVTSAAFKVYKNLYKKIAHKKGLVRRLTRVTNKIVICDAIVCRGCSDRSQYILQLLFKVLLHKQCKWMSSNMKEVSSGKLKILKHV